MIGQSAPGVPAAIAGVAVFILSAAPGAGFADPQAALSSADVSTITIQAKRLSVETKIDRKVYTVTEDALASFGSASDILAVIPSVDVDPDGVVSLRGDSNVLVLIDGKPSTQLQGSAAGDNLQSLAAGDIERIEVLTTPPPQYQAEGAAGVINIVTRKHHPPGSAGTVQGSVGSGGRTVAATTMSHAGKVLEASVTAGFRSDFRQRYLQSTIIGTDPSTAQVLDSRSVVNERIRREAPSAGLSAQYTPNDRQSLSGSASWARRGGLRTYTQLDDSTDPSGALTSATRRMSRGHDPEDSYDTLLRFSQKLGKPGETLDASVHRSISHQHERYDYINDSFVPAAPTAYNNLSFTEDHGITEADLDYVRPLARARMFKAGYAFEQDDFGFSNVGAEVDPVTGNQVVDPTLTNEFQLRQRIHAVYATLQAGSGAWTWLGGLRAEDTRIDAQQVTLGTSVRQHYFELYPSLHVDWSLSDHSIWSFGASRRVTRPQPASLNPYVDHEYTPNLRAGDPHLRPQITQSFELGYEYDRHGSSYQPTAYYRRNRDSVTDLTEYLGGGLSLTTKANLPRDNSAGIEFSATGQLLPKVSYSVSGNAFYSQIDATVLNASGLRSTTGINLKLKIDYRPTVRDSAQVTVTRADRRLTPQGQISAIDIVNLGYKRDFGVRISLVATLSDLFNGQRYQRVVATPTLVQTYERRVAGRLAYVGLVYSFGGAKKEKQANFEYDQGE